MKRPKCPNKFTIDFARELVKYLGGDPTKINNRDCWRSLVRKYPELREKAEKYFATAKTGDPARAAYLMCRACGSSREWAEGVNRKWKERRNNDRKP